MLLGKRIIDVNRPTDSVLTSLSVKGVTYSNKVLTKMCVCKGSSVTHTHTHSPAPSSADFSQDRSDLSKLQANDLSHIVLPVHRL